LPIILFFGIITAVALANCLNPSASFISSRLSSPKTPLEFVPIALNGKSTGFSCAKPFKNNTVANNIKI
jgi:hypothetical protein